VEASASASPTTETCSATATEAVVSSTTTNTRGAPTKSTTAKGVTARTVARTWRDAAATYSISAAKSGTHGTWTNARARPRAESADATRAIRCRVAAAEPACTIATIQPRVAGGTI
jgi:hypothetical protein